MSKKHLSPKTGKMEACKPVKTGVCQFGGNGDRTVDEINAMSIDEYMNFVKAETHRLKNNGRTIEYTTIIPPTSWDKEKQNKFIEKFNKLKSERSKTSLRKKAPVQHLLKDNKEEWLEYRKTMVYEIFKGKNYSRAKNKLIDTHSEELRGKLYTDFADLKQTYPSTNGKTLYLKNYINNPDIHINDLVFYAGTGKKPITNDVGSSHAAIREEAVKQFTEWLNSKEKELGRKKNKKVYIAEDSKGNDVHFTKLEFEILLHASKAIDFSVRGSVNSKAGKGAEIPIGRSIRDAWQIPVEHTDESSYSNDSTNTREIDYKFLDKNKKEVNIEIKMVGKGNPENSDAVYARGSHLIIANHVSDSHKSQMKSQNILYVETSSDSFIDDMTNVLDKLEVPRGSNKPTMEELLEISQKDEHYTAPIILKK